MMAKHYNCFECGQMHEDPRDADGCCEVHDEWDANSICHHRRHEWIERAMQMRAANAELDRIFKDEKFPMDDECSQTAAERAIRIIRGS